MPSQCVAELVGTQYYWIHHYHPAVFLGYTAVLEGYPPDIGRINEIQQMTDYPDSAFRTLRIHGELDPGHKRELDSLLDTLPLPNEVQQLIQFNAAYTMGKISELFEDIPTIEI